MIFPRLVLAGTHSGCGKTTLSLALMTLLKRQGLAVHPFKVGPDYIDPAFHREACGRMSFNLDPWLMSEEVVLSLFHEHAFQRQTADKAVHVGQWEPPDAQASGLSIIEGVMGLYDGLGAGARCSTAHVACVIKAPVVLVVNAHGLSLSAAALASGFSTFRPCSGPDLSELAISGVILNHISSDKHYQLLRQAIEENTGLPCFGWLGKNAVPALPHRHLGLVPVEEQRRLPEYLHALADAATHTLDISSLIAVAENAPCPDTPGKRVSPVQLHLETGLFRKAKGEAGPGGSFLPDHSAPRIGVARDAAFSFYYQDNLTALERLGAQLVFFSPLHDRGLPAGLDGLYLGGGFPELHAGQLENNAVLRAEIKTALESGMPAYAECGGMLYLCRSLFLPPGKQGDTSRSFAMVGFFDRKAELTTRLQPFGYVTATLMENNVLGPAGASFPAHEFHYSRLLPPPPFFSPEEAAPVHCDKREPGPVLMEKADGRTWTGGLIRKNVLAMFPHIHFLGCPAAARNFVSACRTYRTQKEGI